MIKKLYRYEVINYEDGPKISLDEYDVVKETPKGHWIAEKFFFWSDTFPKSEKDKWKWVPKEGSKVFARTTKTEALHDFECRKKRYRGIMQARLLELETVFDLLEDLKKKELK